MDEQQLTGALLVPSVVQYLRPYFNEISYPAMKLCLFCGEALHFGLTEEWSRCLPNATLINLYGPTENTIFCSYYHFNRSDKERNKSYKNILSIGRAMKDVMMVIVNDRHEILSPGEKGELCLAGAQLGPGYWNDETANARAFFYLDYQGVRTRFYRTGDLCIADTEGDIMYIERMDLQVKIQGFRIELLEIEFHARQFLNNTEVLAMSFNRSGNNEIALIVQSAPADSSLLLDYLKTRLPAYMVPSRVLFQPGFPYNSNGKIDRNSLNKVLLSNE
jgi:D-alanine--poly(phosphoribitol) ligase subunit 1